MKVLMINSHFTSGGPPRVMNGIYDVLVANGHVCKVAAARGDFYVEKDSIKIGGNVYTNALKARLFDNEGFNAKNATIKLIEDIKVFNPDIIHLHNLHGYYLNVDILFNFLKKYNKPVVWTLHDMWAFSGHSAFCDFSSCEKWKTKCSKCPCMKEYPRAVCDFSTRNFHKKKNAFCGLDNLTIVTPSNWLSSLVKDSFLKEYPVKTIYNGINLSKFHPTNNLFRKNHYLEKKTVLLGVAAVWNERKGFNDYLKLSKIIDKESVIVLVGVTKKQKESLPSNVLGIEKTESIEQLVDIYSCSNVFINFTYADTLGLVNLEALACGTPVVTYDTGGSPETIDDTCGWVIRKKNYFDVLKLTENFKNKCNYVTSCIARSKGFDVEVKYREYVSLYEQLLLN